MLTFLFGGFGLSTLWLLRLLWRVGKPLLRGRGPMFGGEGAIRFWVGCALVLFSSACLEGMLVNYYTDDPHVGGVVCRWLATTISSALGPLLTSLLMLVVLITALPSYTDLAWGSVHARISRLGEYITAAILWMVRMILAMAGRVRRSRGAARRMHGGAGARRKPAANGRKTWSRSGSQPIIPDRQPAPSAVPATASATGYVSTPAWRPAPGSSEPIIRDPWLVPKSQRQSTPPPATLAARPASSRSAATIAAMKSASPGLHQAVSTGLPERRPATTAPPLSRPVSPAPTPPAANLAGPMEPAVDKTPAPLQQVTASGVASEKSAAEAPAMDPALAGSAHTPPAPVPAASIPAAPIPVRAPVELPHFDLDSLLFRAHQVAQPAVQPSAAPSEPTGIPAIPISSNSSSTSGTSSSPITAAIEPPHTGEHCGAPVAPSVPAAQDEPAATSQQADTSIELDNSPPEALAPPWRAAVPVVTLPGLPQAANDDGVVAQLIPSTTREAITPPVRQRPSASLPPLDLLAPPVETMTSIDETQLAETGELIEQRLREFKVPVTVVGASAGPVITRFEVEPAVGVRGNLVVALMKDLARGLGRTSIRVVETIPGKTCMGLELPNEQRQMIALSEILDSAEYRDSDSLLTLAMGKGITGEPVVADLAKAPHMLVAGTTGSGKSVAVNAMILSMLYKATPEEVRLIMIDPKMLELSVYEGIPHLLAPVVTDMKLAANALAWCVAEMENRYRLMSDLRVRNLAGFNQKVRAAKASGKPLFNPFPAHPEVPETLDTLPMIVVVIDELADLMMVVGKKIEELIARLAQKARAAGIHLILATQRPSVDVITGLIKANIPTRVAFQVSSKIDSRTILDQMGAESLLGQGDMLFMPPGTGYPQRIHGAFVGDDEVLRIVAYLKQFGEPDYIEDILAGPPGEAQGDLLDGGNGDAELDPLYDEAAAFVLRSRRASISFVQRQFRIGYNRAARLVEAMEAAGLVSSMGINGQREVIAPPPAE